MKNIVHEPKERNYHTILVVEGTDLSEQVPLIFRLVDKINARKFAFIKIIRQNIKGKICFCYWSFCLQFFVTS